MRGLQGVRLVAEREIREGLRRKSFWAVLAVLFAGSTAAMVVPEVLGDDAATRYDVAVVDATPSLEAAIQATVQSLDARAELRAVADQTAASRLVDTGDADIAVVAGAEPSLIVRAEDHELLIGAVQQALAVDALVTRLQAAGLSDEEVDAAINAPPAAVVRLDADQGERQGASGAIAFVLYLLLIGLMVQVSNGTAVEKANRISEVLLGIVRPGALLFGKVLGIGCTGILTLSAAMLPVVVKLAAGGDLPEGLGPAIAGSAAWFLLGLALYLTIAGALGALVERQEEAGSVVTPVMALLIATFFFVPAADTPLGTVLAYVPFTSPLMEPARLALGVSNPFEVVGSLAIGVATVVVVIRLGGVVYERAVVRTGRRLTLREVLRRG